MVMEIIDNKDMIKEERAKKAKEHYEQMNEEFRMEILSSIKNSKVYRFCKDNSSDLINNTNNPPLTAFNGGSLFCDKPTWVLRVN